MAIHQTPELERAMQLAADQHATDVYLLPGEPLSFRKKGEVTRTEGEPLSAQLIRAIATAAAGQEAVEHLTGASGRVVTSCALPGQVAGQLCIASAGGQISITVQIMPSRIFAPEELALPQGFVELARTAASGLLLFAGTPGSGKTTTLFSILDDINGTQAKHICTVENPRGPLLTPKRSLVQQREVGTDVPDCLAGIGAAMRQDADVICIGELGTPQEVEAAVAAAQMQYLVLTQVGTARTPALAIQRLIEVQPPQSPFAFRARLSQVLRGAISQVLLPRCDGRGWIAAYGVLIPDEQMRRDIRDGRDALARKEPMPPGCQDIAEHVERLRSSGTVSEAAAAEALEAIRMST